MRKKLLVLALLAVVSLLTTACGVNLGAWKEGWLDIHSINSARGECTFIVFPDGSTLLVDVGEFDSEPKAYPSCEAKPNKDTRAYKLYADYIRHFKPGIDSIDCVLLTHFHMDHIGQIEPFYDTKDNYVLSGVTALYSEIPYRKIVDRAYPYYDSLTFKQMGIKSLENYRKFIKSTGVKVEQFELGSRSQLGSEVLNICANSRLMDGSNFSTSSSKENSASCGFLLSYGDFDYYSAGDIGYEFEIETARLINRPIEALKSNHHLSPHTTAPEFLEILKPSVITTQSFYVRDIQPDKEIIRRIGSDSRLYFTNIDDTLLSSGDYNTAAGVGGHIIIRVAPGGKKYYVIMLNDSDLSYRVKQVDGPFYCKK